MATIEQLAEKLAKAEAEVARLRVEIASRAGEADPEPEAAVKPPAKATATKKAAG